MISSDWQSQIFEKKNWRPEIGPNGSKSGSKLVFFCHFLRFGSLVFIEIAYNDSLHQCITSSRVKAHEKNLGDQVCAKTGQNQVQN